MLPLSYPRRWKIAGFLLLIAVLAAAVAPAINPGSHTARWLPISDKWLHGITFAILAVWYSGQFAKSAYWRIAIGLVVFGGFIEFCQSLVSYRTAETGDFIADVTGIVVGLTISMVGLGGWSVKAEHWMQKYFG